jgi:hypothetical protein
MTKTVAFRTPKGTEISITLVTERGNIADHNFTEPCWALEYRVAGKLTFGTRINHPQAGPAIELDMGTRWEGKKAIAQSAVAPIPADKLAEVDALIAEFEAGVKARVDAKVEAAIAEAEYDARYAFIASDGGAA